MGQEETETAASFPVGDVGFDKLRTSIERAI
jgi:hypothetical protein